MPGHHDAGNEYTSLEDAQNAALYAKEQGLGGKYTMPPNEIIPRQGPPLVEESDRTVNQRPTL